MSVVILGKVDPPKQPYESFPIGVDFRRYMKAGTTISSGTVTAKRNGSDTTNDILDSGAVAITGFVLSRFCKADAGTPGQEHILEFRIVTSDGQKLEAEVLLPIEEA